MVASLWALDAATNPARNRACPNSPSILQRTPYTNPRCKNPLSEINHFAITARRILWAVGNLTEENLNGSRVTNVYDNENRLTNIKFPDASRSTYTYNGDNLRRTKFEAGGGLVTVIWDGDDYLLEKN